MKRGGKRSTTWQNVTKERDRIRFFVEMFGDMVNNHYFCAIKIANIQKNV